MLDTKSTVDEIISRFAEKTEFAQQYSQKVSDVLLGPLETEIGSTPYDIVYEEDRVRVKHYKPPANKKNKLKTPLLINYALINRETMLDLQQDRSVVKSLLDDGVEIYMVEWGYPTRKDKFLTIDDHVNGYLDNIVDFIRVKHNIDKINLMGICMGGTFCIIYSALHPDKIENLVTTVTPSSFDNKEGLLHVWMQDIDVDMLIDTYGNMPGDLMNFGFLLLNPARLMIDKYEGFVENMHDKGFVENFVRMEKWIFDSPDVPGETFRQFINDLYKKNLLIQSELEVGGKKVDLKKVTMPMLNIYAKFDHLVPPAACDQITSAVGSKDTEDVCLDTGHIGIYVSSRFQKEFAPKVSNWLKDRQKSEPKKVKNKVKTESKQNTESKSK